MFNSDTELLFPLRVLPEIKGIRSETWAKMVDQASDSKSHLIDQLAMELMLVKLAGCVNCDSDSFRAMKGCEFCIRQALHRFKGSDGELLRTYEQSKKEIGKYCKDKELAYPS
jgi:hypothetical protein